jgi:hypothetical protein
MAKVLGQSGRYVSEQAVKKRTQLWLATMVGSLLIGMIEGILICLTFYSKKVPAVASISATLTLLLLVWLLFKTFDRKVEKLERERTDMLRGANGEVAVGLVLSLFPDEFRVINDLTTPFGNLDHVVIGPTGVFVLDTKNWRGVVSADGEGELLVNGKTTNKRYIRQFTGRMMGIRDKVRLLAPGVDPFYNGVFVFTAARVDAKWGATGTVNCIREEQLHSFIVEKDFGKKLRPADVDRLAQAFLGLAHMDNSFTEKSISLPTASMARA